MNDEQEPAATFPEGGMWEHAQWELWEEVECSASGGQHPCRHCHSERKEGKLLPNGNPASPSDWTWICPRVVVAYNEGGCNTTGVCADCIVEAMDKAKVASEAALKQLRDAFRKIGQADVKPGTTFVPEGSEGDRLVEHLKHWGRDDGT